MSYPPRLSAIINLFSGFNDAEKRETLIAYADLASAQEPRGWEQFHLEVQTLTRAMSTILCMGLDGIPPADILAIPSDFIPKIVGAELVMIRSQTVYYLFTRIKGIVNIWLQRERAATLQDEQPVNH